MRSLGIIRGRMAKQGRETILKTSFSYRAVVDYDVDRLGVEVLSRIKLTSTNSLIGLIYALKKFLD